MKKLLCIGLCAISLYSFGMEVEIEEERKPVIGVNPAHQMYLDLKAKGYTETEAADAVAESGIYEMMLQVYPLEDCFKETAKAHEKATKTCQTQPKEIRLDCLRMANNELQRSNTMCGGAYSLDSVFGGSRNVRPPTPMPKHTPQGNPLLRKK